MRIIYLFIFLTLTHCTAVPLIPVIIESQNNEISKKKNKTDRAALRSKW